MLSKGRFQINWNWKARSSNWKKKDILPNNNFLKSLALRVASSCISKELWLEPLLRPNLPIKLSNLPGCWALSPTLPGILLRLIKNLPSGQRIWTKRNPILFKYSYKCANYYLDILSFSTVIDSLIVNKGLWSISIPYILHPANPPGNGFLTPEPVDLR